MIEKTENNKVYFKLNQTMFSLRPCAFLKNVGELLYSTLRDHFFSLNTILRLAAQWVLRSKKSAQEKISSHDGWRDTLLSLSETAGGISSENGAGP